VLSRRDSFTYAVRNIARYGDTDVFPFPPENHIFHDRQEDTVHLLEDMSRDLKSCIENTPPIADNTLSLVTYEGYRWVTQIDPIWNAYFLGLVLKLSPEIERARIGTGDGVVFSHRMRIDDEKASLFADNAWNDFIERSDLLAQENNYVVTADIADFYGHLYHHRVDNALQDALSERIEEIAQIDLLLRRFSGGASYGLPIGGPAARILSEATLNRVDQLLRVKGITFCRYADDYRLFAKSQEEAYRHLYLLTESLLRHEGLSLQKQKTRVLRAGDYLRSPLFLPVDSDDLTPAERQERRFLRLSLRFDPYSSTADEDYERLQTDLQEFDIVQMLTDEVNKSRINTAVVRRLARALKVLDRDIQHAAVGTILKSLEMLAPALPVVLQVLSHLFPQLSEDTQRSVTGELRRRIKDEAYFMMVPVNLAYALRVLQYENSAENVSLADKIFNLPDSPAFIQRDVVYLMYGWGRRDWISDQRRRWANLHPWVQRAVFLASYSLLDEGSHWRRTVSLRGFDLIAKKWMDQRTKTGQKDLRL